VSSSNPSCFLRRSSESCSSPIQTSRLLLVKRLPRSLQADVTVSSPIRGCAAQRGPERLNVGPKSPSPEADEPLTRLLLRYSNSPPYFSTHLHQHEQYFLEHRNELRLAHTTLIASPAAQSDRVALRAVVRSPVRPGSRVDRRDTAARRSPGGIQWVSACDELHQPRPADADCIGQGDRFPRPHPDCRACPAPV
jgi:hypothetical protein